MKIEVSNGEIVDKYTILLIKQENIKDETKLANVEKELEILTPILSQIPYENSDFRRLFDVNSSLWYVEDEIRKCDRAEDFSERFVFLAKKVYKLNDQRAAVKKLINQKTNSELTEEKSYEPWK
jgi:hypothetical protein